jgi:hypothetical protein
MAVRPRRLTIAAAAVVAVLALRAVLFALNDRRHPLPGRADDT